MMGAALFPALAQMGEGILFLGCQRQAQEDGLSSVSYMTDKIRYTRERTAWAELKTGSNYPILAYNERDQLATYFFLAEEKKWKLQLYNGRKQPLTGDNSKDPAYAVTAGRDPYISVYPGGLVRISYAVTAAPAVTVEIGTAVLPLYDYFLVGDPYESDAS